MLHYCGNAFTSRCGRVWRGCYSKGRPCGSDVGKSPWSPLSLSSRPSRRASTCQIASVSSATNWSQTSGLPTICSGCNRAGGDSATRRSARTAHPVGCANRCECPWQRSAPIQASDGRGSEIRETSPCESVLLPLSQDRLDLWARFHRHGYETKGSPVEFGKSPGFCGRQRDAQERTLPDTNAMSG